MQCQNIDSKQQSRYNKNNARLQSGKCPLQEQYVQVWGFYLREMATKHEKRRYYESMYQ